MTGITTDDALAVIRAHCAGGEQSIRLEDADATQYDLGPCDDGWQIGVFEDGWHALFWSRTLEECILEAKRRGLLG